MPCQKNQLGPVELTAALPFIGGGAPLSVSGDLPESEKEPVSDYLVEFLPSNCAVAASGSAETLVIGAMSSAESLVVSLSKRKLLE